MRPFVHHLETEKPLSLDGESLRIEEVVAVARHARPVALAEKAKRRIARCRQMVNVLLERGEKVYGLTTGFGKLRDVPIANEDVAKLQKNLIMSHACGVGEAFSEDVVRAAMLLRINTLCKGNSGIRLEVVQEFVNLLNDGVYPYVPEKGSVGASGDLAPLSHLVLVLMGHPEGRYLPRERRDEEGRSPKRPSFEDFRQMPDAADPDEVEKVAAAEGWTFRPISLEAKEGLALNNGTQFMTAVACLALRDSHRALRFAELAGALSLEAQRGVRMAYDPRLHAVRPHDGQPEVARRVMAYCEGSEILDLYLNSAHLYRACRSLEEAEDFLRQVPSELESEGVGEPPPLRHAREELQALRRDVDGLLAGAVARGDESGTGPGVGAPIRVAEMAALPPRQQIELLVRRLRPTRKQASDLLSLLDGRTFPQTDGVGKARSSLVAAVGQLDAAVPSAPLVQDDYSFRCFPQVLSCGCRAFEHVVEIVEVELNSATDNPLLFPPSPQDEEGTEVGGDADMDPEEYAAWLRADEKRIQACLDGVLGGGNFHGEPVAVAVDYLTIAMAEVASISERRIAHLVDAALSQGLPGFLIESSGLNSGFMIPQYTAAALVSENKVLAHPASVDSIPTSANSEDHVSMGTIAARKSAEVVSNVLDVISIEILTAYQGLKFRLPLQPGEPLRRVVQALAAAGVERYEEDRVPYPDFRRVRRLMEEGELAACLIADSEA